MLSARRSEQGQVIVLFVVFFSMVLILLAFAVDQGYWYGRRRISQGEVDAVARAGAFGYFTDLTDEDAAENSALRAAGENNTQGLTAVANASTCAGMQNVPSILIRVENNVPGLFTSLPLIGGDDAGVNVGAQATACVGGVELLEVDNINNPSPSGNVLKSIPIGLQHDVGGTCFDGGDDLRVGRECVLLDRLSRPSDLRVLVVEPSSNDECEGQGSNADPSDIASGIEFMCVATTGNSCSGSLQCVRVDTTSTGEQVSSFFAMASRLNSAPNCDGSFTDAFGGGNAPPKFGGSAADRDRVYLQTGCFNSRRLVVLPVVEDSGGSSPRNVRGFATVYVTGCYHQNTPLDNPGVPLEDPDDSADDCVDAAIATFFGSGSYEIRGVPINMYITNGSLGGLSSTARSSVLTVQTVQ